jgi:cyclophilin family peptidyl-prolyl cis-trans isomerase
MVAVQKPSHDKSSNLKLWFLVVACATLSWGLIASLSSPSSQMLPSRLSVRSVLKGEENNVKVEEDPDPDSEKHQAATCPYKSLADLTPEERFPKAGKRHQVQPPTDTKLTLVCCQTTKGPWSILVHHAWAPLGAKRFLEMVSSNYFSNKVPLMRCLKKFLCQFGLAGAPSKLYGKTIPDDPPWLPQGPDHRKNEDGVKRFAKGYLAYAGGGQNSRNNQFIIALNDNGMLAGGSPWETPWVSSSMMVL